MSFLEIVLIDVVVDLVVIGLFILIYKPSESRRG